MFLLGMAPLGLGCGDGKAEDDDGTGTDTGETGSTGPTGTGTTAGGTATTVTTTTTDEGDPTDGPGELCEDYVAAYENCYGGYYPTEYMLESCEYALGYIEQYYPAECLSAWEARIACMTTADCGLRYEQCQVEFTAEAQACSDYDNAYYTCYLIGEFVGGCTNPNVSESAMLDCLQTHENLYNMYGGACGDAFVSMMACISQLDCLALSDKAYVYASCGPQIDAKNAACQ